MDRENKLKEYYKSKYWKAFIKELLKPDDVICDICGCKRWKFDRKGTRKINRVFNIHHKHYNHLNKETRNDVMILCRRCHQMCHDILKISSDTEAIKDIKEVINKYFIYEKRS